MINLSHFNRKFNGVIHVGAHSMQELEYYKSLGIKDRLWIDGTKRVNDGENYIQAWIGDGRVITTIYHASNNGESTSLLKPTGHLKKYPEIKFTKEVVDEEIKTELLLASPILFYADLLVLDIQGLELATLKSCGQWLKWLSAIVTEAYTEELYEGCGMLTDIDKFLFEYGFERVEFEPEEGKGWGNAYYLRK